MSENNSNFGRLFLLLFGETLAAFLGVVLTAFTIFHIYLTCQAMTTIEFCEKSKRPEWKTSRFDRGTMRNFESALGDNKLLWFLPCSPPSGDGLHFVTEQTPLVSRTQEGAIRLSSR
jgi:hypothetical protein